MNIYLVERNDEIEYEEYDSFVCCAKSKDDARAMHPSNKWEDENIYKHWVNKDDTNSLSVTMIGFSTKKESRVILSSYNAG